MNKFDLPAEVLLRADWEESRYTAGIEFSVLVIKIRKEMPNNYAANHLDKQLLHSGTSVSLNYGEAQSGESRKPACPARQGLCS